MGEDDSRAGVTGAGLYGRIRGLEVELEESRQAYEDLEESVHADIMSHRRTEQGLQMKIADLMRENGMLKNELRAVVTTIENIRNARIARPA